MTGFDPEVSLSIPNFVEDMLREDQFAALFPARMREPGRRAFEVKIINLSVNGFCAEQAIG